jgi:IS5 family transposase
MLDSVQHQPSLFYAAFAQEAHLLHDAELDELDGLLDDEELVNLVRQALKGRRPRSAKTGRKSIAPDRLLRCAILKARRDWSLRDLEREVRGSLLHRRFTRFDSDPIPKFSTFSRNFALLDDSLLHRINERVVQKAVAAKVTTGARLRTDTTVTETNIHHPTDSTLLGDGIRVLTRNMKHLAEVCAPGALKVVDKTKTARKHIIAIHTAAKSFTDASREKLAGGYRKLVSIAGGVLRKATKAAKAVEEGALAVGPELREQLVASAVAEEIRHFEPLVKRVIARTKARVFKGDTHFGEKILSLFEPHTQVIRKGKAAKPTELGRLIRVDEVDGGIVSNYDVLAGNQSDQQSWEPALSQHEAVFGRPPRMATVDRGFHSAKNVRVAEEKGVKQVVIPARGRLSKAQEALQKKRWFSKAQGWRAGVEARIGTLKHRFGMNRARFKHEQGFKRSVGWSVITNHVVCLTRELVRRRRASDAS